jgi:PAS domain-containing protein
VGKPSDDDPNEDLAWAARVQRLEAELAGLRRAMRSRALIEQAKGLLVAALGGTPDEAFAHLAQLSQRDNLRVAEIAARIVGAATLSAVETLSVAETLSVVERLSVAEAAPAAAETATPQMDEATADARHFDPTIYLRGDVEPVPAEDLEPQVPRLDPPSRVHLETATAAINAVDGLDELASRLLDAGLGWLGADSIMLYRLEPDGALQLLSCAGLPAQLASDWQRIPSVLDVPMREAIITDRPIWTSQGRHGFCTPLRTASATLPLRYAGRPFGALAIGWQEPRRLDTGERRYLTGLAACTARRARELTGADLGAAGAAGHWLRAALDVIPVALLLLTPVRDPRGTVVDFLIDYASPRAGEPFGQKPDDLIGARLLDVRPHTWANGVFDAYCEVLATGVPWRPPVQTETVLIDGQLRQVLLGRSATRLGDGLLATWRQYDAEAQLARVARMEDLAGIGYGEWDRSYGEQFWSPGLFRIFDRSPALGPIGLDQFPAYVEPAELATVEQQIRTLTQQHRPVDLRVRIRTGGTARLVRARIEPVVDQSGELRSVHLVVMDITDLLLRADLVHRRERVAAARRVLRSGLDPSER